MPVEQAIEIVEKVFECVQGTLKDHQVLQEALETLKKLAVASAVEKE